MNKKKVFVGFMAIGIAVMLVALPYESDALVITGYTLNGVFWHVVNNYLNTKNNEYKYDNVVYLYNATTIKNEWLDKVQQIRNELIWANSTAWNLVEMYKNMDLVYIRYAEREALEHLDKSNWSEVVPYIFDLLENDTKMIYLNIIKQFIPAWNEFLSEVEHINEVSSLASTDDIIVYYRYQTSTNAINEVEVAHDNSGAKTIKGCVGLNIVREWHDFSTAKSRILNNSYYYYNISNFGLAIPFDINASNASYLLSRLSEFAFYFQTATNEIIFFTTNITYNNDASSYYWTTTSSGSYDYYGFHISITIDGETQNVYFSVHDDINLSKIRNELLNAYNTIKATAEDNAYSLWNYYKSLGYNNISQLPTDDIPVFPDNLLDNAEALGNLSYDDAYLAYLQYLHQLATNPNLLNQSVITWDDINGADYSGKMANIKLVWANETENKTIFDAHRCYIIPLKQDLTISVGNAYYIGNLTITDATKNNMMSSLNISTLHMINQQIYINDIDGHKIYYIKPTNEYAFYIYNLTEDNKSVESITLEIQRMSDLYFPDTFNDNSTITNPVYISNNSWLDEYKGWFTIGSIILGILLMAGSRKGTGIHVLGLILLIAGLGMAIYWYLLPAWNNLQGLNPLNWFK